MPGILDYFRGNGTKVKGQKWPELEQSWAGREIEMPQETQDTSSVRPMNWYEKNFAAKDADAITWPWGTIALNKDLIEKNKSNLGDVLVHELTHVGQNKTGMLDYLKGLYRSATSSYEADPREQSAFAAEVNRKVRKKDIDLDKPARRK